MKTTKLILVLTLCFGLFSACSSEEIFNEDSLEATILNNKVKVNANANANANKDNSSSKKTKNNTKEQSDSNTANKTEDWFNNQNDGSEIDPFSYITSNYIEILVEYYGDVTQSQKEATRAAYGAQIGMTSFQELDNDSDLWIVDEDLYNSDSTDPQFCCPKIKSTEAEVDDIEEDTLVPSYWQDVLDTAATTVNPNFD